LRRDSLPSESRERESEQPGLNLAHHINQILDFVLDDLEYGIWELMSDMPFSHGPCTYHMDESFLENGLGLGKIAEFEVRGGVFGDLFPESGLELEEVVVNSGSYYSECIIQLCKREERFALYVSGCYVDGVKVWRVVVEYSEEVVILVEEVLIFLADGMFCGSGGCRNSKVCYGTKEGGAGRRRFVADRWGSGIMRTKEG
jgi:hypothetical protein